jgi:Na+/H+ antiporter NhaD/arsenite permease-like protein
MLKKILSSFLLFVGALALPSAAFASGGHAETAQSASLAFTFPQVVALTIFVAGYIAITLEHKFGTNKSAIALLLAGVLWLVAAFSGIEHHVLEEIIHESGAEIFEIIVFLLAAMSLVEILVHYRLFDIIRLRLMKMKLTDKPQFVIIALLTFFLSAALDNLTITIVMIQIARRFFKDKNLLIASAGIVIMANAGGAWSPIGDVTTIMIWLAGKFSASEIISQGVLPSMALATVSTYLLRRKMDDDTTDTIEEKRIELTRGEKLIMATTLVSFTLPVIMHSFGLRPYMGLLLGLGLVWAEIEFIKTRSAKETHLEANIEQLLQKADISSLKFFIGILLSVSALKAIGLLNFFSHLVFGAHQEFARVAIANVFIGLMSAIVDNVPLTALSIDVISIQDPHIWVLLALAVGTGGSFLVIGSVAGIIAMGMVKGLTFDKYLKIASIPALVGYIAAMSVWFLQYQIIK